MGYMEALGRVYDLSIGVPTSNIGVVGGATGKRVSVKHASGLAAVLVKQAGTAGQDPVLTISYTTVATGGSLTAWPNPPAGASAGPGGLPILSSTVAGANLSATPQWYYKKAAVGANMTGGETWTRVFAASSSGVLTLTGESTNAGIYVIPLNPTDPVTGLGTSAGGFPDYVEIDIGSVGAQQWLSLMFILHDLEVQEDPTRMFSSQT